SLVAIALTVKEGLLSALPVVPVGLPTFQADPIKVTVVQLVPTSDNSRVVLTFTIENTTSVPVYFALQAAAGYLTFALSDDRATVWSLSSVAGIDTVPPYYDYSRGKQLDFTPIIPSQPVTVLVNFTRSSGANITGSVFGFTVPGYFWTATGLKNVSIG